MILRSNPRSLRATVVTVLMVWLFALGAGWANACLLEARGTHVDNTGIVGSDGEHASTVSAGHVGAVPAHDEAPGLAKAPCQKVCSDGAQTIVKLKPTLDLPAVGMAPALVLDWTPLATAPAVLGWARARPTMLSEPPLRIRYARLAL
ncbi:MAG: hypothetical protein Q8N44_18610 [Rubrivivax sp.]|nr:hypothetical protein [Rubrivivax sp.]MDP3085684.1 hypothetical protein [Rubrivivax sp.]